jgi:hypothetical protein
MAAKRVTLKELVTMFETQAADLESMYDQCDGSHLDPSKFSGAEAFKLGVEFKDFYARVEALADALSDAATLATDLAADIEFAAI